MESLLSPDIVDKLLNTPMLLLVIYFVWVLYKTMNGKDEIIKKLIDKVNDK